MAYSTHNETLKPELLITARSLLGFSQAELAEVCEVGVATIRRLETQPRGQSLSCSTGVYEKIVEALRAEGVSFFQDMTPHETRRTVILYDWEDRENAG